MKSLLYKVLIGLTCKPSLRGDLCQRSGHRTPKKPQKFIIEIQMLLA